MQLLLRCIRSFPLAVDPPVWQWLIKGVVFMCVATLVDALWLALGHSLHRWLGSKTRDRYLRWGMATLMMVAVLWAVLST